MTSELDPAEVVKIIRDFKGFSLEVKFDEKSQQEWRKILRWFFQPIYYRKFKRNVRLRKEWKRE